MYVNISLKLSDLYVLKIEVIVGFVFKDFVFLRCYRYGN